MTDRALRDDVLAALDGLERRVERAVDDRRHAAPRATDDPLRGLYLTDDDVRAVLDDRRPLPFDPVPPEAAGDDSDGHGAVLAAFAARTGLTRLDVEILLVALAPDLDPRFERLYGYLHDDVTRRRASIGLALRLAGAELSVASARARLDLDAPLVQAGLVEIDEPDRPWLGRGLRVPDVVTAALLGDARPDPLLALFAFEAVSLDATWVTELAAALAAGVELVHLHERSGGPGRHGAVAALEGLGRRVVALDLTRLGATDDAVALVKAARRSALLADAALVAGPVDDLAERHPAALRALLAEPLTAIISSAARLEPAWSSRAALVLEPPPLTQRERAALWRSRITVATEPGLDPGEVTAAFRLGPEHIARGAAAAQLRAVHAGRPVRADDLHAGARTQNSPGLQRLSRRIEPSATWDDLILPAEATMLLHEVTARIRHREHVLDGWGLRRGGGRGEGVTAMFAGPSGTGKTLAAEVIAHDLGLDLYAIDLARVVSKYIGETEKNLDNLFDEAEQVNCVLFFDEADALFGKRSEVRDARDRYANVEVAYLLQRMERFDGLAILATNLRANLDEAFARRLDIVADFALPDETYREQLWRHSFGPGVPLAADVDLAFCAEAFELSGGHIRNIAVTAAFLASSAGHDVTMREVISGVHREYRKLGRLSLASEFGPYYDLISRS